MQKIKLSQLELLLRWILGLSFIIASFHKIIDPNNFAKIIYGYYLFPNLSINMIAIILPYIELYSGLFLIAGWQMRSACMIINAMLIGFIIALSINLIRDHQFDCGCFSFGDAGYTSSVAQVLIRDIILLIMGLFIIFKKGN